MHQITEQITHRLRQRHSIAFIRARLGQPIRDRQSITGIAKAGFLVQERTSGHPAHIAGLADCRLDHAAPYANVLGVFDDNETLRENLECEDESD